MRSATKTRSTHTKPSKVEPLDHSHGTRALRLSPLSGRPHQSPQQFLRRVPLRSRCLSELPLVLTVVLLFALAAFL